MKALNLYLLTREIETELVSLYESALSERNEASKIRKEEIAAIKVIVNNFTFYKAPKYAYDNWFYSFSIPQIGKEFDLLKIGLDKKIINIEIKSQSVPLERIEKQLVKNRYYLSHITSDITSIMCVENEKGILKIYQYDDASGLTIITTEELVNVVSLIEEARENSIEDLFTPKDFLISPLNTPSKFINGRYYLTNQQEQIKKKITESILTKNNLWGIKGAAGTGKTLLLYDIAKTLAEVYNVGIIHSGLLNEGHAYLNTHIDNIAIIDAKSISAEWISKRQILCVDETQRLYSTAIDLILKSFFDRKIIGCIFSYDYTQALSKSELGRNNPKRLKEIVGYSEECLTERIRTNKELCSFIRNMLRLYDTPREKVSYNNVDVLYANDTNESDMIIDFYREKGYKFITYTPSQYVPNSIDHYSGYINSHQVIGQEFDKVILVIDCNFRYSDKGELEAKEHPNPDYLFPRLFYQNISRAREKLCLVTLKNPEMFEKLLKIKSYSL